MLSGWPRNHGPGTPRHDRRQCPPGTHRSIGQQTAVAQFIAVCSSAKPCEIGENLLSVSDPISRLQERLIDASALIHPSTLQRRTLPSLHPYAPVERTPAPMSPVPEPRRRSLGYLSLPPWVQALLVQRLQADLQ